jgi:thiol:disulfide interchange protein DsbD
MAIRLLAAALVVGLMSGGFLSGGLLSGAAAAQSSRAPVVKSPAPPGPPKVSVSLLSETAGVEPGASFWVGLRQRIAPGWHTYWTNPGDSGEPPTLDWALPAGFTAGPLVFPHPQRIPVGPLMSYGYTDEVVLLTRLTAPGDLAPGATVTLRGHAAWLVCEKICIPEEAAVSLTLPVVSGRPRSDATAAPLIERARQAVPAPSPWPASLEATPESVTIQVAAPRLMADRIAEVWFFPDRWGVIDHAGAQEVVIGQQGITLRAPRGPLTDGAAADLDGVLVIREKLDQGLVSQAFAVRAAAASQSGTGSSLSLLAAMALALAGGLILNLMPCVLPVLAIKALALVGHAGASRAALRGHGLAYTAGVLASFAVLAGALLALRAGGAQIGWGFQLQSPLVVTVLAYVLFTLGLGLSGILVIGGRFTGIGQGLSARPGYPGSFFTGALATVAATPCTAPFMGVAVGYALGQPAPVALAVFQALGLGLALPFLLLSLVPAWRRLLPRPGPWMARLAQALAFPLYASVAWLVWVLSRQVGPDGVALALAGLLLIGFAAWLRHASRAAAPPWRRATSGIALGGVAAALALAPLAAASPPLSSAAESAGARSEPFSPKRLAELRAQGRPVFVNFTAAWCITCLVNERVALGSPAVAEALSRRGVVYLKADWTNRSAEIATVLESFGRSGVPLYVVYPARKGQAPPAEPRVLPQILSEATIIDAIDKETP